MSLCRECQADILFGRTTNGRPMPIDPGIYPDTDARANLAVYKDHTGRINVRVLRAGEEPESYEKRGMPHFATCPKRVAAARARRGEIPGVIPFPKGGRK